MKSLFLVDLSGGYSVSYEELLAGLRKQKGCNLVLRASRLLPFYQHLILAMVNDLQVYLVDEDFELPSTLQEKENTNVLINKEKTAQALQNWDTLQESLRYSKATLSLFTSGTTAVPKQINYPIGRLLRNIRIGSKYAAGRWAFCYHPAHMAGLQVFLQALLNHNLLVNFFGLDKPLIVDLVERFRISHISATPTFYRLLFPIEKPFEGIQGVSIGGERSSPKLHARLRKAFPNAKLYNLFATTETGTLFASEGDFFRIPEAIRSKVKFVNNELLLHRDLLADPSILDPEKEWYQTGDTVIIDETGRFQFAGRKKDTVNVAGYRVKLIEIEEALDQIPGIQQYRVYGRKNALTGHIICCDIKLLDPDLSIPTIKSLLKENLQAFKVPRIIKIVEEIPITYTGKIKR
ncbi:MAG: AMP-binding protein [Saprospiraceae bacterium]|nr:AMP-binding protein [Saprospiraceae bacterium]